MSKRLPIPRLQAVGLDGRPLAGAKLYTYVTGTNTPKATYSDAGLSILNANPLEADASGRFGPIYVGPGDYRIVLEDAAGTVISTDDPVEGSSSVSGTTLGAALTLAYANPVFTLNKAASGQANTIEGDTNSVTRWRIIPGNATAETGSNAGSDLDIEAYNDAGSFLSRPVRITRSTGAVEFGGNVNIAKEAPEYRAVDTSTSAAGGLNVDGTVAGEIYLGSFTNTPVNFGTNNASRVRMDAAGVVNFGVGATVLARTVAVWHRDTPIATTSGTAHLFTPPAGITPRRFTVLMNAVSTNGASAILIRLGASGSVENTGYSGSAREEGIGSTQNSTGVPAVVTVATAEHYSGRIVGELIGSNIWAITGLVGRSSTSAATVTYSGYVKTTAAALDRVQITTASGDTFDNGSVTVIWE